MFIEQSDTRNLCLSKELAIAQIIYIRRHYNVYSA